MLKALLTGLVLSMNFAAFAAKPVTSQFHKPDVPIFAAQREAQLVFLIPTIHRYVHLNELPVFTRKIVQSSELFINEVNFADPSAQRKFKQLARKVETPRQMTWRKSLKTQLTDEEWKRLRQLFFVPEFYLGRLSPRSVLELMERTKVPSIEFPFGHDLYLYVDFDAALDRELEKLAREANVETFSVGDQYTIENIQRYLDVYFSSRTLERLKWILQEDTGQLVEEIAEIVRPYLAGDLERVVEVSKADHKAYEALLLNNRDWFARILQKIDGYQNVTVAAGAAHFAGDNGFLKQFQNAGFSIKRVESSWGYQQLLNEQQQLKCRANFSDF